MEEKEYYVDKMNRICVSKEAKNRVLQSVSRKNEKQIIRKMRTWGMVAAITAAALALFVIPSPLSARAKAYCRIAVYNINEMIYGAHEDVSEYTTSIVQSDTDGNLTLQLNEVLLDGNHLIINYTVSSTTPSFFTRKDASGTVYEGYYNVGIKKLTINGVEKKYAEDEISFDSFYEDSSDSCTYAINGEHCLHDFSDVLKNPEEVLDIRMEVIAQNEETGDIKHFSFAFTIKNRELQLETKEIAMNQILEKDGITFTFEKMCINTHSQRIYFYVDGMSDFDFQCGQNIMDAPYSFGLQGVDNNGNTVFAAIQEIRDGYGYFELIPYSDTIGLDQEVEYYDFQMEYDWVDPEYVVCDDAHEGEFHGEKGVVGESFRITCK